MQTFTRTALLGLLLPFFCLPLLQAQTSPWLPAGANENVAIHRLGHVGIGGPPQARLHISQTSEFMANNPRPRSSSIS